MGASRLGYEVFSGMEVLAQVGHAEDIAEHMMTKFAVYLLPFCFLIRLIFTLLPFCFLSGLHNLAILSMKSEILPNGANFIM